MTGAALRTLIAADARVLWRDPLLVWMMAVPIGMALLIRFLARAATDLFPDAAAAMPAYHPVVMGGYLMTAPGMIGFVIGFLLLDERDAGTLRALRVTPLSMRHYLAYRVAGPLLVGAVSTIVGYPIAGLVPIRWSALVVMAALASLAAPLLALVLAASARPSAARPAPCAWPRVPRSWPRRARHGRSSTSSGCGCPRRPCSRLTCTAWRGGRWHRVTCPSSRSNLRDGFKAAVVEGAVTGGGAIAIVPRPDGGSAAASVTSGARMTGRRPSPRSCPARPQPRRTARTAHLLPPTTGPASASRSE